MKLIKFLLSSIASITTILLLGIIIAYYFVITNYDKAITSTISTDYLKIPPHQYKLLTGKIIPSIKQSDGTFSNSDLWRTFHLENIKLELPIKHPLYSVTPQIKYISKNHPPLIGIKIIDRSNKNLLSIIPEGIIDQLEIVPNRNSGKIFQLPIIKKFIKQNKYSQIWKDLFSLSLKKSKFLQIPYKLALLKLRINLFERYKISSIAYISSRNLGIISLKQKENDLYRTDIIFLKKYNKIYKYRIKTKNYSTTANNLRDRYLNKITIYETTTNSTKSMYARYKKLPFKDKIGNSGLCYLLAAWSHMIENKRLLEEIVHFLEKGRGNLKIITPFYDYAYKRYGTNFSIIAKKKIESEKDKFSKVERERLERELLMNKKTKDKLKNIDFTNSEEVIDLYIQLSKEKNSKTHTTKKRLIIY